MALKYFELEFEVEKNNPVEVPFEPVLKFALSDCTFYVDNF